MKVIIAVATSFLFSSCMSLGMLGMGGMDSMGMNSSETDYSHRADTMLEKEVVSGGITAVARIPALTLGNESNLTLTLTDTKTKEPLAGATVFFHAAYLHTPSNQMNHQHSHMEGMNQSADSSVAMPEQQHEVNVDEELSDEGEPGTFIASYTPVQEGDHRLMFHITAVHDQKLEHELIVEAARTVTAKSEAHSGGMHGGYGLSDYAVIGAAAMTAMMVVVWASGGRIF